MKNFPQKQKGVVLVIGLLMLLVITMVGVTAMSGTTANERMTANYQFQTLSFQAAESAIHDVFDIPSVTPAMAETDWRLNLTTNSYDVNVHNGSGSSIGVQAQADIQFCGETAPPQSDLSKTAIQDPMYQIYDVRGSGDVASLGSMETHMRRGGMLAGEADMAFDDTKCDLNQ